MAGAKKSLLGRKRSAPTAASGSAKRKKLSTNELPWKPVARSTEADIDFDEGILGLEEVDDVEVVYEEMPGGGRVARFNVLESALEGVGKIEAGDETSEGGIEELEEVGEEHAPEEEQESEDEAGSQFDTTPSPEPPQDTEKPVAFDPKLIPEWAPFNLDIRLQRALYAQKFMSPTPIQSQAIPKAVENRDIIGVAETGSGKTLAYGLPILNALLAEKSAQDVQPGTRRPVRTLILAPTRELALQVSAHLNACLNDYDLADSAIKTEEADEPSLAPLKGKAKGKKPSKGKGKAQPSGPKKPPLVSVAAIVGGMSAQKQKRILERGVDVLVATPGRLWDILEEDDDLAKGIKNLRYLVLDEADRMIETGHFAELDNILRLTQREAQQDVTDPDFHGGSDEESDGESSDSVDDHGRSTSQNMQTFVFSATLSKDLQRNLKKRHKPRPLKKGEKPASTLDDLIFRLDFRDAQPEVIDLSPEGGVVSTLQESRIDCLSGDKDIYLYYFLLRYPGRSLVFLSAIDGIRRLLPMLELLGLPAFPLHSQLEQRQRLKNLDRFKSHENAVLLATDIAARGLDIPSVDHVVHYQIPRTADSYVHRNGRTARARRSGFSMLMCAPDERRLVRALLGSLGRQESDIPEMAIDHHLLDKLKPRLQLAKQIDNAQHKTKKENHERNWLKATADAMDIELGSDFEQSDGENTAPTKSKIKARNAKVAGLKAELKELLSQPLVARGVSTRYITSGSRPIVDDILAGEYHEGLIGVKKSEASNDLVHPKKGAKKAGAAPKEKKEEYEEWGGFGS
ncbi:DEAD-domain-containing protein [Dentipellis sp. KUC8613]|nr:DEAD-domain-containing protein [Dentipellis sp. KUC8613]